MSTQPVFQYVQTKPQLPKARHPEGSFTLEQVECVLIAEYVVIDYGSQDDMPSIQVLAVYADFGGLNQVTVPLNALSGEILNTLESEIAEKVCAEEHERRFER